jgi:hypothetical protein
MITGSAELSSAPPIPAYRTAAALFLYRVYREKNHEELCP